jgi:phosphate transport system protein
LRGLQEEMQHHPEAVESATHFVFAAKNFERIADYATSLARTVHYVTTGVQPGKEVLKASKQSD